MQSRDATKYQFLIEQTNKLNSKVLFLYSHMQDNFCSSTGGVLKSSIFVEVILFKNFKNKTPLCMQQGGHVVSPW